MPCVLFRHFPSYFKKQSTLKLRELRPIRRALTIMVVSDFLRTFLGVAPKSPQKCWLTESILYLMHAQEVLVLSVCQPHF